jgi:hypothetical protein
MEWIKATPPSRVAFIFVRTAKMHCHIFLPAGGLDDLRWKSYATGVAVISKIWDFNRPAAF